MPNVPDKIQSDFKDQTVIVINGKRVEQFSNESITLSIDNVGAGFSFTCPFFPGTKEYRDIFRPHKFQDCQAYIGGNLVVNGTIEKISPTLTKTTNIVNVQVRSKTGVLVDCNFEKEDFPIEFKNADLEEIANGVVSKFGLSTSFPDGSGATFEKAGPSSPTEKRFNFLQNYAKQRGLLMGQTSQGDLLFRKPNTTGDVVAELIEGQQGILISSASYDGTKRFSSYDVFGQEAGKNDNFAQLVAEISKKPVVTESQSLSDPTVYAIRPKSIQANDTNQGNIEDAARRALTSDIAESINIPLGYEGWLRPDGALWKENDLILVQAPSIMIYKPFALLIKTVVFSSDENSKVTNFTLTIPEAYTDTIPTSFPWDE